MKCTFRVLTKPEDTLRLVALSPGAMHLHRGGKEVLMRQSRLQRAAVVLVDSHQLFSTEIRGQLHQSRDTYSSVSATARPAFMEEEAFTAATTNGDTHFCFDTRKTPYRMQVWKASRPKSRRFVSPVAASSDRPPAYLI